MGRLRDPVCPKFPTILVGVRDAFNLIEDRLSGIKANCINLEAL